jgi:uroporphyrinogen decarboxylase
MDMKKWVAETIASTEKQALPVLTFPAIQKMGVDVPDLLDDVDEQIKAMSIIHDRFDIAATLAFMDLSVEAEGFGSTVIAKPGEVPTVVGALLSEDSSADDLNVPDVHSGRMGKYIESVAAVAANVNDRPVLAGCIGPYSLAGRLMDVNEIMLLSYEEPELVHAVLDKVTNFLIDYAQAYKEVGADGVVMAEPLAGLLSPTLFGEFSTDYVKRIVDAVQDDSFIVVYHNCGPQVITNAESIASIHAAGYHFGNAIDMADILPLMPQDSLVMGNIDPTTQFMYGNPQSVYSKTMSVLAECASYPNFVISSGCDIPPLSPWENIDAFFAATSDFYAFGRSSIRFNQSPMAIATKTQVA